MPTGFCPNYNYFNSYFILCFKFLKIIFEKLLTGCVFCAIIIIETKEHNNKKEVTAMITKELLKKALQNNVARIGKNPFLDDTVCWIGDNFFYFDTTNSDTVLPDEYLKNHNMKEIIEMVYDVLEFFRKDEWDEYDYYEAVLNEMN